MDTRNKVLPTYKLPKGSERNISWKSLCPVSWSKEERMKRRVVRETERKKIQSAAQWRTHTHTNTSLGLRLFRGWCTCVCRKRLVVFRIKKWNDTFPNTTHIRVCPSPAHTCSHTNIHTHAHYSLLFIVYSKQERLPAAHFRKNKRLKQSNSRAALLSPTHTHRELLLSKPVTLRDYKALIQIHWEPGLMVGCCWSLWTHHDFSVDLIFTSYDLGLVHPNKNAKTKNIN